MEFTRNIPLSWGALKFCYFGGEPNKPEVGYVQFSLAESNRLSRESGFHKPESNEAKLIMAQAPNDL